MNNIIGFGHKARQGKDVCAEIYKELNPASHIIHWADALKEECKPNSFNKPLIYRDDTKFYFFNKTGNESYYYDEFNKDLFPELNELFNRRNIKEFMGVPLGTRDSEMWQLWGTNYRRRHYGELYWVNITLLKISNLFDRYSDIIILIPDTRFLNEYYTIKNHSGIYIEVERYNEDGSRFIDEGRDPNHISETVLDSITPDILISAKTGDIESLKKQVKGIM